MIYPLFFFLVFLRVVSLFPDAGMEPLDAMSLRYADTSLPDLLDRLSLPYADHASVIQTVSLLCSERASAIQNSFFKILFFMCNKKVHNFFLT